MSCGDPPVHGCIIDYPPFGPSPYQPSETWPMFPSPVVPCVPTPRYTFTTGTLPAYGTPPLSDADVERIARRLAEILREPKP